MLYFTVHFYLEYLEPSSLFPSWIFSLRLLKLQHISVNCNWGDSIAKINKKHLYIIVKAWCSIHASLGFIPKNLVYRSNKQVNKLVLGKKIKRWTIESEISRT